MRGKKSMDSILIPSPDIVARIIEGEIIVIPIVAGIGDLEDELYTFNKTGREIWELIDGKRTIKDIVETLGKKYDSRKGEIDNDVINIIEELIKRKILNESTAE